MALKFGMRVPQTCGSKSLPQIFEFRSRSEDMGPQTSTRGSKTMSNFDRA